MSKETIYREDVLRIIDRKTVRGKLQVAREVLKLPPADVQLDTKELVAKIKKGISATNADDVYSCGMRDGMRWCMSLVDNEEPLFEDCPSAQPDNDWIPCTKKAHPDTPFRVQVQLDNGWIITAYYQDGEWLSVPDCGEPLLDKWIEAWRELPEPYQEEGKRNGWFYKQRRHNRENGRGRLVSSKQEWRNGTWC